MAHCVYPLSSLGLCKCAVLIVCVELVTSVLLSNEASLQSSLTFNTTIDA